jgi:selenocysteine-specific elongation factor
LPCRVRPLDELHVRLTVPTPVPLRFGDRAVLRDPGRPGALVGVTVLETSPPPILGRGAPVARGSALKRIRTPVDAASARLATGPVRSADLAAAGLPTNSGLEVAPGWWVGADRWADLATRLANLAGSSRLLRPVSKAAAARELGLPHDRLVDSLARTAGVTLDRQDLPADLVVALDGLDSWFQSHRFDAPPAGHLAELGLDERALAIAARSGRLLRLGRSTVLGPDADVDACAALAALPAPFRVTDACIALRSTRRTVVPLLEHLDRTGRTRRDRSGSRVVVTRA